MVRTWKAIDCCTNLTAVCTQTVTVTNVTQPPFLTCPANIFLESCDTRDLDQLDSQCL